MALQEVLDALLLNVPDTDLAVLGTRRKEPAVGAEADAANVQVARPGCRVVHENTSLRARLCVIDLRRAVASRREVLAVVRELDAANNRVVNERVDQRNVQLLLGLRRPDREPVRALLLQLSRDVIGVQI